MDMAVKSVRYSTPVAYVLWAISGCGALGLHRFYLGKAGSGFLWLVTGGLFGVGCVYDAITLPRQVREANIRYETELAIESGMASGLASGSYRPGVAYRNTESPEKTILRLARRNGGSVTPGEVAIESDVTVDQARKELDRLLGTGMAEIRVRESGVIVYYFPEFSREKSDYVDLG
jgi:TM2 domain-containing membrane protein YozV